MAVVLITDTVLLPVLATYSRVPSALIANALGEEPTETMWVPATLGSASISWPVAVLNTDTVLLPVLATYTRVPSGLDHHTGRAVTGLPVKVTGAALVINAAVSAAKANPYPSSLWLVRTGCELTVFV